MARINEQQEAAMSKSALLRVSMALIALAAPATADAQTAWSTRIDTVRQDARLHAGPFYAKPRLVLKDIGTDSNVFNAAGDQKSDFTITLAPLMDVWVPVARRALLKTTLATDLVWYAQYEAERSLDPQLTVRGEAYLNRILLFAESGYLNTRQRPNYEVDVRSRHVADHVAVGGEVALTPKLTFELAGRRSALRYDADALFDGTVLQRTLNRQTDGVHATVRHQLTPLTTIAARFETMQDRFEYSPLRDSASYRIMPGVEFRPQALLKGTAYVGYRKFRPAAPRSLPAFAGLVGDLSLSYTLLGATSFGVSYRRDLTYSYEERQPFFVDQSIGASIRRALGSRFDVTVSADRHRYEYRNLLDAAAVLAPQPDRHDAIWNYAGSVGYRIGQDGRIGFGLTYVERTSNTKVFRDYDRLRVGCSVSYGF
jgi:hypothetical protein